MIRDYIGIHIQGTYMYILLAQTATNSD